jgi:tetratricopeptide (TPR) repeat protein
MQDALHLPGTTALQIHMYGRQLLTDKRVPEAVAVFEYNAQRNGDAWPVHVGLARGYAAAGENQKALEHAKKALQQAPDKLNRDNLESMVKALSAGQPVTQ